MHSEAQFSRNSGESLVDSPERKLGERRRGQQVHVNPTEATPHQLSCFDECQDLGVASGGDVRQLGQGTQQYRASSQVAARQLPNNEGMSPNLTLFEEFDEGRITTA